MAQVNETIILHGINLGMSQQELESRGFIGFSDVIEVVFCLLFRQKALDEGHIDRLFVLDAPSEKTIARENTGAHLLIPRTADYIEAFVPENSPHQGYLLQHLLLDAEYPDAPEPFADWWLRFEGTFYVKGFLFNDLPLPRGLPVEYNIRTDNGLAQPSAQNMPQAGQQQLAGPNQGPRAPATYGIYKHHSFSQGTRHIWYESGIRLLPYMDDLHSSFHPIFSNAPVYNVDLRLLGDVRISHEELIVWFPDHLSHWPDAVHRLHNAGWNTRPIMDLMYTSRGLGRAKMATADYKMFENDRSRLTHYRMNLKVPVITPDSVLTPYTDLTLAQWEAPRRGYLAIQNNRLQKYTDYYVRDLADYVVEHKWPNGNARGALTCVIEMTRYLPDDPVVQSLKLSDVSAFSKKWGLFDTLPADYQ